MLARIAVALAALALILPMARAPTAQAATPQEIETAVTNGLAWLAAQQIHHPTYPDDGSFVSTGHTFPGGPTPAAATCLALTKFEHRGWELYGGAAGVGPFDTRYAPYNTTVVDGLNYVFRQMAPATNGGVYVPESINNGSWPVDTYTTGICMMALASTMEPAMEVSAWPSVVYGASFQRVLQGMLTWMEDTQFPAGSGPPGVDDGCYTGGWGYYYHSPEDHYPVPDNSITGYATLGIRFAISPAYRFNLTISNPNVLANLDTFITNIQADDGGSIYICTNTGPPENILKTANLLDEMAAVGWQLNPSISNAVGYITSHWNAGWDDPNNPHYIIGWQDQGKDPKGDYQAMFAMMKGLEAYGVNALGGGIGNWFGQVSNFIYIHHREDANGWYWTGVGEAAGDWVLETSWALLTLEKVVSFPPSAVGGVAELPALAGTSPGESAVPAEGSGWSAGGYAALAGGLAAAVVAITAGAWYARRRWLR